MSVLRMMTAISSKPIVTSSVRYSTYGEKKKDSHGKIVAKNILLTDRSLCSPDETMWK